MNFSLMQRAIRKAYRIATPAIVRCSALRSGHTVNVSYFDEFAYNENLIIDLGMNDAKDTAFYLRKGFAVVAVEANPIITQSAALKFESFIKRDRLCIINKGITDYEIGQLEFYVNHKNSEWSSFVRNLGCRGGEFSTIQVDMISLSDLFKTYGTPYYLKVDIEGYDHRIIDAIKELPHRPRYISVEECGPASIDSMKDLGATSFKLVSQSSIPASILPNPATEGRYIRHLFPYGSSGAFGEETPGEWRGYEEFRSWFASSIRSEDGRYIRPDNDWFDIHAKFF